MLTVSTMCYTNNILHVLIWEEIDAELPRKTWIRSLLAVLQTLPNTCELCIHGMR
jgi:hypothetical protein